VSLIIRDKKGATFFTLDTMIAGFVILVTIILVMSVYTSKPVVEDTYYELNNYMQFLSSTTMRDVRDNYQFAYSNSFERDLDSYVYQKVYKLYLEDNMSEATRLIGNLTGFVVPEHLGFEYAVGSDVVYATNVDQRKFAKTSLTSRLITYYFNESDSSIKLTTTNVTVWS
jgi:hypothetical protein